MRTLLISVSQYLELWKRRGQSRKRDCGGLERARDGSKVHVVIPEPHKLDDTRHRPNHLLLLSSAMTSTSPAIPQHSPSLHDRMVVIVSGSSGIGFGVAKAALAAGARIVVSASSPAKLQATLDRLNSSKASGNVIDVRSEESITAFFASLDAIDHLIFTAGDTVPLTTADIDARAARGAYDVRYFGMLDTVRHALPKMRSHYDSTITLTSGVNARRPALGFLLGSSVGGAVESATKYLAKQCAPIRVNAIALGAVHTELWDQYIPKEQQSVFLAGQGEKLPVKHIATADEVAEAYTFCWRCGYITGQIIDVDGGSAL